MSSGGQGLPVEEEDVRLPEEVVRQLDTRDVTVLQGIPSHLVVIPRGLGPDHQGQYLILLILYSIHSAGIHPDSPRPPIAVE